MKIHIVRSGDTLWDISKKYNVNLEKIVATNGLRRIPYLVIGQSLVIPSEDTLYNVKKGDTLWDIAKRYNVAVKDIISANTIYNPNVLYPGAQIRIPGKAKGVRSIEVNGYLSPTAGSRDREVVMEVGRYLTYLSPFSHAINSDGSIRDLKDDIAVRAAKENRAAPLMVLTNFSGGNFNPEVVHSVLTNESAQNTLISNIITVLKSKGYSDLNIDFERIPPEDRQLYNAFLRKVVSAMHNQNYKVSVALVPKPYDIQVGEWHGAHDYKAIGEIADFVVLMTYEWGWSGGPPMAVAPINEVRAVVSYAASVIPSNKIMMGIPYYGYNWTLPYVKGGKWALSIGPQEAVAIAAKYGAEIKYDSKSQSPYFNYTDEGGKQHVVWFEDARSIEAKFNLVNEFKLRGVSYWVLGPSFPQNWAVLDNMFNVIKI